MSDLDQNSYWRAFKFLMVLLFRIEHSLNINRAISENSEKLKTSHAILGIIFSNFPTF